MIYRLSDGLVFLRRDTQIRREFYEFGVKSGPNRGFAPKMFAAVDHFS